MSNNQNQLVWVNDKAGNRYLCPFNALIDANSVSEEEKRNCVDDASRLGGPPASRPGHIRA